VPGRRPFRLTIVGTVQHAVMCGTVSTCQVSSVKVSVRSVSRSTAPAPSTPVSLDCLRPRSAPSSPVTAEARPCSATLILRWQKVETYQAGQPVKLTPIGGGGTDFRTCFHWLEERRITPQTLVFLQISGVHSQATCRRIRFSGRQQGSGRLPSGRSYPWKRRSFSRGPWPTQCSVARTPGQSASYLYLRGRGFSVGKDCGNGM